ncbi:hypothetical protein [Actinomadura flavalba]|nr:hypothetical protein [Actinomadura flavalba]
MDVLVATIIAGLLPASPEAAPRPPPPDGAALVAAILDGLRPRDA